jgi:hypothetical protein
MQSETIQIQAHRIANLEAHQSSFQNALDKLKSQLDNFVRETPHKVIQEHDGDKTIVEE